MVIKDSFAVKQAIANVKLENLKPCEDTLNLIKEGKLTTTEIIYLIKNNFEVNC